MTTPDQTSSTHSQRSLLYAAIADIGSSVRANDAKASAALVVHGLMLAGITTLVSQVGDVYNMASSAERIVGVSFLGLAFAAFLISVMYLLAAVSPYRPTKLEGRIRGHYKEVFFPTADILSAPDPHTEMANRLASMREDNELNELIAETLKLADILTHESRQTKGGYRMLRVEILATAGFFVTLAIVAL
jgi:hypothetical protein